MATQLSPLVMFILSVTTNPTVVKADGDKQTLNILEFRALVKNNTGTVRCGLFNKQNWLKEAVRSDSVKISNKVATCMFRNLPKGVYGVSAYHDENNNGKLDTNFIGMPTEDYGASRDARGTMGPPKFEDAKFQYEGGPLKLQARLK